MAFRLRSRRPVLANARTEHNGQLDKINFFIVYLTEPTGEGRFLPIVYARQFYSPRPPTDASLRSASGRPGRIGSLITLVWQGCSGLQKINVNVKSSWTIIVNALTKNSS